MQQKRKHGTEQKKKYNENKIKPNCELNSSKYSNDNKMIYNNEIYIAYGILIGICINEIFVILI